MRHLVRLIGNTDGSYEKREAQRCVEEWLLSENGSVEALADSLAHVYDGEQPANGPRDLRLTPLLVARQIQGRVLGLKALSAGRTFSDQWWWWARHAHLHSAADFFAHRGQYERETAGTEAARLYSLENVVQVCSSACLFLDRYVQATTLLPLQEQRSPHALAGLALH
ncbi:hypothetical protein [Ktedonobacter racemifer]|uniref:Uncharacterized protein n=1 Tax=Ktedonobacter racemifer DSM 44963 TaxID=485913 RepID=D6U7B9_KTERA|nr:hypothetical protein [Ktedonobacter racemifer]EFH79780.1 hypothetical protein Krac_0287 [Ktedonobacter racemifer DSM 44963]